MCPRSQAPNVPYSFRRDTELGGQARGQLVVFLSAGLVLSLEDQARILGRDGAHATQRSLRRNSDVHVLCADQRHVRGWFPSAFLVL